MSRRRSPAEAALMSFYERAGKRTFDVAAAAMALVLLSPVIATVAVLIALKLGRPVLFTQERTGWKRRPFRLIKFRSMLDTLDNQGRPMPDEMRLTPFGRWLRAKSLDELPSLLNVLKGEMSFVGPRPFMHRYDKLYTAQQARRFEVRPGITGWAQINGRNAISWEEKFALDVWYVDNRSLALDFKILAASVGSVLSGHGIAAEDSATMPEFTGSAELPGDDPGR
jgi:sugar transferase EpsL